MSGGSYFANAGVFLIDVLFGLYILAVMLRFFLQVVRADFYNPVSQAIVTVTNPPLRPMRRYIRAIGTMDTASLLLMLGLQLVSSYLVIALIGVSPNFLGVLVTAIAELIHKALYLFIFAVIIQIVLSWVAPGTYNPIIGLLDALTAPLMRPARRLIPPLGGLDLSPMLVLIGLSLGGILLVAPLRDLGRALM